MAAAGVAGAPPAAPRPPRQVKLDPQSELRVEVLPDAPLRVRLVSGTAEIFGTELPPEGWVPIPPRSKIAVRAPSPIPHQIALFAQLTATAATRY
jgi:polyribonucleotide 5'-hydroxyl-kinase